ncbi:hypothetical protein BDV09DRAFT_44288 [Aspergillus tetrazonus]
MRWVLCPASHLAFRSMPDSAASAWSPGSKAALSCLEKTPPFALSLPLRPFTLISFIMSSTAHVNRLRLRPGRPKESVLPQKKQVSSDDVPTDEQPEPLPPSPSSILSQEPSGRAHTGEVTRRNDRRTSALPPPASSRSGGASPNGRSSRRRGGASPLGDFDSDSDSESDDNRRRRRTPHDEDEITPRRQGRRPEHHTNSSHYATEDRPPERTVVDEEEELRYRNMLKTLRFLEDRMCPVLSISERSAQEQEATRRVPAGDRPGAIRSEIHEMMLEYVDGLSESMFADKMEAFMRQNEPSRASNTSARASSQNWIKEILKSGRVRYEYMEVDESLPGYMFELFGPRLGHCGSPIVFQVLVKDNKPMHAEPVSQYTLLNTGWNSNGSYWWRYERGSTKFTYSCVYRVRMTGQVDSAWSSGDRDERFEAFMNDRRTKRKHTPVSGPPFRWTVDDITAQLATL